MLKDLSNFQRQSFNFGGNYRAIVEDNNDPLEAGRVRVRIVGLHSPSPDEEEAPVENLPWAEPAIGLYTSGGKNLDSGEKIKRSKNDGSPPKGTKRKLDWTDEWVKTKGGTGGNFTAPPRIGSVVWVFFENEDHTRPHYWAMSPGTDDYKKQKKFIKEQIDEKIRIKDTLSSKFVPDSVEHKGSSGRSTESLSIKTPVSKPQIDFAPIKENMKDISVTTSPGGVTHITVHKHGSERHYMFHKSYIEYTDQYGQTHHMVGQNGLGVDDSGNDYRMMVGNNYDLHVLGDMKIHCANSVYIQADKAVQINANDEVGVMSKGSNINILSEGGAINMEATDGFINLASNGCQIDANGTVKINASGTDGCDIQVSNGPARIQADEEIILESGTSINLNAPDGIIFGGPISTSSEEPIEIESQSQVKINAWGETHLVGQGAVYLASDILTSIYADGEVSVTAPVIKNVANGMVLIDSPLCNIVAESEINIIAEGAGSDINISTLGAGTINLVSPGGSINMSALNINMTQ